MFHRLEPIRYAGLEKLNEVAYLTVTFGLNRQTNAAEPAVKADFIAWLAQHGFPIAGECSGTSRKQFVNRSFS